MSRRTSITVILALALAVFSPAGANAAVGNVTFAGGTAAEQAQVHAALASSSFNFNILPQPVQVTFQPGVHDYSTPGQVYLDPALVDEGQFAWGTILDEFGHEVDLLLLNDAERAQLQQSLGGSQWWTVDYNAPTWSSANERFATMLAWAYWPSPQNCFRPTQPTDGAASMPAPAFRALVAKILGPQSQVAPTAQKSQTKLKRSAGF